ncbi:hypothetical protein WJX82_002358 [Trebouxia sp. C0006]
MATSAASVIDLTEGSPVCKRQRLDHVQAGTVQLGCEVVIPQKTESDIPSIKRRINPYGLQRASSGHHDEVLCIENLFDCNQRAILPWHNAELGWETAKHVGLAPSPLPADAPAPPPPERVRQITLCYHDGRQPPVTYGINLNGKATCREILSTLEQIVHVAENEEFVLAIVRDMRCCRVCILLLWSADTGVPQPEFATEGLTPQPVNMPNKKCFDLHAKWHLEPKRFFNMGLLSEPQKDPSANEAAMAETRKRIVAQQAFNDVRLAALERPYALVTELKQHARGTLGWKADIPVIRLSMTLEPDSDDPQEVKGTLMFKVWCDKEGLPFTALHSHQVFKRLDAWTYENHSRHLRFCLHNFFGYLCAEDPHYQAIVADVDTWKSLRKSSERTLPGLMNVLQSESRPEAAQPEGLAVELRPYQRQSLHFMLDAEQTEGGFRHHLFHPVTNSQGQQYWCSPHLGRLCLHVPPMPHGGFLGEELGLGKTVDLAALILSRPAPPLAGTTTVDGLLVSRATLVVCPVSLMGQWATELADKTNGRLKVLMHHGLKRSRDPKDLLDYDVVLVTYQIIAQEWVYLQHTKSDRAKLAHDYLIARIKWHRLVLDEAHTAKTPRLASQKYVLSLSVTTGGVQPGPQLAVTSQT